MHLSRHSAEEVRRRHGDETLLVLVGEWACTDEGSWKFVSSRGQMARCITLTSDMGLSELKSEIAQVFDVDFACTDVVISFWYPGETVLFTQTRMPPISIASDSDLTQFRKKRLLFDDLNIYVAFRNIASSVEPSGGGKCFSSEFDDSVIDDDKLLAFVEGVETYYRQNLQLNQGLNSRPNGEIEQKRKAVGGDSLFQGGNGLQSEIVFEEDVCKLVDSSESVSVARKRSRKQVGLSLEGANASPTMELRGSVVVGVGDIVGIFEDDPDYAFHALASLVDRDLQQSPTQSGQSKEFLVSGEARVHCTSMPSLLEVEPLGFSLGLDEDKAEGTPIPNNPVHQETMVGGSIFELGGPSRECLSNIPSCSLSPPSLITPLAEANKPPTIKPASSSAIMSSSYVEEDVMNVGSVFFSDDEDLLDDGVPVLDNMVAPPHDERNMGLKMAGDALYVGRIFHNKEELNKFLSVYAMKRLFCYRVTKSDTTRLIANCVDHNCSWRVYAIAHKFSENFEIRTLHLKHNCDIASRSRYGEKATSRVLADLIQSKFANGKKGPRACELPDMLLAELKVSVSYMKAWHAKELAMARSRGNDEDSFKFLCTYLHLLQTANPGTLTDIVTSEDRFGKSHFKYLFLAFGASVAGYAFLRKVIIIDGTQLKGKYKGCLVAASCQDGNLQIFPLAFGVVDGENEAAWVWFFQNLSKVVPDDEELVFVSDRHPAIYAGLQKVFPTAHHAACTVHLCRNVNHRFKNEGLAAVVSKAARAYIVGDFRYWWAEIEKRSLACAQYLLKIGLPHWALSQFPGCRYNIMSSNISESLNSVMKKAIDYPLVSMLEFIRMKLMRWFSVRREKAKLMKTRCTREIEKLLLAHHTEAAECGVLSANEWIYQVNDGMGCVFTVDLANKTCSCQVFDVLKVPCPHAIAARRPRQLDIYSFVGKCYSVEQWYKVYEEVILPLPKAADVDVPDTVSSVDLHPPATRRPSGRPRKQRIPSRGEIHPAGKSKMPKCGRCFGHGHNRQTCKSPI